MKCAGPAFTVWILALAFPVAAACAAEPDLQSEFEKGFYKEQAERDLEAAVAIYAGVAARQEEGKKIAAKALVRMGICLGKLGRTDEARKALERVAAEFKDQKEAADEAQKALADLLPSKAAPAAQAPETPGQRLRKALASTITLDFPEATLSDMLAFLAESKGINVVLDPGARSGMEPVMASLSVRSIPVAEALSLLARLKGLDWAVLHGVVYVADPRALALFKAFSWIGEEDDPAEPESPRVLEIREALAKKFYSYDVMNKPLERCVSVLQDKLGFSILFSVEVAGRAQANVARWKSEEEIPLGEALASLLEPLGLEYGVAEEGVVIVPRKVVSRPEDRAPLAEKDAAVLKILRSKAVSMDFMDTPLDAVVGFLREVAGINLVLTGRARAVAAETAVTLRLEELRLDLALRVVLSPSNLLYRVANGVLLVDVRDPQAWIAMRTGTDFDFANVSLAAAVEFLAGKAGLPVSWAPGSRETADRARVTRQGKAVPVENALTDVLAEAGLEYGLMNGAIVIDKKRG
ncbi:MAG: hypothetical protein MUC63_07770 [Planctomycetes bacterium]|nr:hypothetical protein [Planctomycetota bacterium]